MAEEQNWAAKVAARIVGTPGEATEEQDTDSPPWARVLADRANGREPDSEVLALAQRSRRPPRTEMERQLLERLGYGDEGTPPPAA
ncbi:hypothetical protein [Streptomyces sp. NPDC002685]|uniref:hypothetical protein n=1 Tax=Streptomyces sp. NPDC002685 TaxID=3154540 RepID=UPI003326C450